nr:hypothetical protein [Tanacetum cinerariifolium]
PDRVYKVEKALYGLHQAPRAWYETLLTYLFDNGFQRGKIDKTLFIKRDKGNILLVQVYVDDIIFGLIKKELCFAFEKLMHEKFQMSSMGELIFFLGLQVKQKKDGLFISQDKYVVEILKKFRSMIGSLMSLTLSRPDIMFTVCACARYQVNPMVSHLHVVKRIFSSAGDIVSTASIPVSTASIPVSTASIPVSTTSAATTVSVATTTTAIITTIDDVTLDQGLEEIKNKGRGILIEPVKPKKGKDQIRLDKEAVLKLRAEFDEEERLTREKAKKEQVANIVLIETRSKD